MRFKIGLDERKALHDKTTVTTRYILKDYSPLYLTRCASSKYEATHFMQSLFCELAKYFGISQGSQLHFILTRIRMTYAIIQMLTNATEQRIQIGNGQTCQTPNTEQQTKQPQKYAGISRLHKIGARYSLNMNLNSEYM